MAAGKSRRNPVPLTAPFQPHPVPPLGGKQKGRPIQNAPHLIH